MLVADFYANGAVVSFILTMLVQSILVVVAKRWNNRKELLLELSFVFTFMRPIVDMKRNVSWRRLSKQKNIEQGEAPATMSVYEEFMYMKGVEVGTQNLPCSILQCSAFLIYPDKFGLGEFNAATLSVAVGCFSAAFITTCLTFDKDLDPKTRRTMPEFYGMIPDNELLRNLCFCAMMLITTSIMVCRVFTMSMLGATDGKYLIYVVAAEVGTMLLIKLLRKDLKYWIGGGPILSLIIRIFSFATASYTSILKLRHPLDFGGLYFSFSMIWSLILFVVTCVAIYDGPHVDLINDLMQSCCAIWAVGILALFALIKRRYWRTFWSTQTGSQFLISNFKKAPKGEVGDEIRSEILYYDYDLWKEISPEFKEWLLSKWRAWQISKPEW